MTDSIPRARVPGRLLMKIARRVFNETVVTSVVVPTIADMQREAAAAGPHRGSRRLALWNGYRAFWTLVLLAPVAFWRWPTPHRGAISFPELTSADTATSRPPEINFSSLRVGANAGGLIFAIGSIAILVVGLPEWRWFFLAALLGGLLVARALLAWHNAHPGRRGPQTFVRLHP